MILDSAHFIFAKKRKGNAKYTYMNKRAIEDQGVILVEFGSKKVDEKKIKMNREILHQAELLECINGKTG